MSTISQTLGHSGFDAPRATWRQALGRLLALDALFRERHDIAALDDHLLRDIGITRADARGVLGRPGAHLRLVVARGCRQLQH